MGAADGAVVVNLPGAEMAARAKRVLSLLRPVSVVGGRMIRRGRDQDGGYVILDALKPECPIYSLGVGWEVSFDLELAELGHPIFQYDHTVDGPPIDHPNFHFRKQAIDTGEGSLKKILQRNRHFFNHDLFLNMDIEGHEFEVIPSTPQATLDRFSQIVIEIHWLTKISDDQYYARVIETLQTLRRSHEVIHVHANNWGYFGNLGGVGLPDSFELTLVKRSLHSFECCEKDFPTELDRPCNPDRPDYPLGKMGLDIT